VRETHARAAQLLPSLTAAHHSPASLNLEARAASFVVVSCCGQWLQGTDPSPPSSGFGLSACPCGGKGGGGVRCPVADGFGCRRRC
jgi:hypothetical protein